MPHMVYDSACFSENENAHYTKTTRALKDSGHQISPEATEDVRDARLSLRKGKA